MIDIKELRIGNIVTSNILTTPKPMIVYSIGVNPNGVGAQLLHDEKWSSSFEDFKLVPIPLTEEILLKCGFEKREITEDGIIYGLLNTTIIYGKTTDGDYAFFLNKYCNDVHLKCVHQLQNLYFALTGKELEVNI